MIKKFLDHSSNHRGPLGPERGTHPPRSLRILRIHNHIHLTLWTMHLNRSAGP